MSIPALDDEQLREAAKVWEECGRNWAEAARRLGVASRATVQNRVRQAARKGFLSATPVLPGFQISRISTGPRGETVEQKPETTEEPFEAPLGFTPKKVTYHVKDGNVVQSWPRFSPDEKSPEEIIEVIKAALDGYEPPPRQVTPAPAAYDERLANVFLIADAHMGLMAWGRETGGPDYDLKIAGDTIRRSLHRLAANTPDGDTAVILGLGDNSHTDGYKNVTPQSGHALDADGRWPKILEATIDMFLYAISVALLNHMNVIFRCLPGNHDPQTAIAVAIALALYYRDEPRVTVVKDPGLFWWWEWGASLIGAVHGDKAKMKDLPLTMAARNAEAWGRTRFRYVYTGHIHHQTAMELGGVIVESFQSPAAPDAYNAGMGYSNGRSLKSVSLHKTEGEVGRQTVNIF